MAIVKNEAGEYHVNVVVVGAVPNRKIDIMSSQMFSELEGVILRIAG